MYLKSKALRLYILKEDFEVKYIWMQNSINYISILYSS